MTRTSTVIAAEIRRLEDQLYPSAPSYPEDRASLYRVIDRLLQELWEVDPRQFHYLFHDQVVE